MGVRDAPCLHPKSHPSPVVCIVVVIFVFVIPVFCTTEPCAIDSCFDRYNAARKAIEMKYMADTSSRMKPDEMQCVAMRTYARCMNSSNHGCLGSIRYHSVKLMVDNYMKRKNCSDEGDVYTPKVDPQSHVTAPTAGVCSYTGEKSHRHCALFGDPHLNTFGGQFQTCRVRGTWPLIRNDHLTVQVTNSPVGKDGSATATSTLTIVIKANEDCGSPHFIMYMAHTDNLPSTFEDGQTFFGIEKSVQIIEHEYNRHIEMYIRYIDTRIIVRQIGSYFTFSISIPEAVLRQNTRGSRRAPDLQLCVDGCPKRELFNYQEFLSQKSSKLKSMVDDGSSRSTHLAMRRIDAAVLCREAGVTDFYFDSCVFDLMMTGDRNFTLATSGAYQDAVSLDPQFNKTLSKRQDFRVYDLQSLPRSTTSDACSTSRSRVYIALLIMCLYISVTWHR